MSESPKGLVRLSMSDDIFLEFDRLDEATLPVASVAISAHRDPDKFTVSLKGIGADHVFVIDTSTATLQTLLFRTNGSAVPWSRETNP